MNKLQIKLERLELMLVEDGYNKSNIVLKTVIDMQKEAINYTSCCTHLKDEGQASLTEYAYELISMQENPQYSNKDWKIVVIKNTIGKLYETLQTL
jgi:hypothetical protein